MGYHGLGEFSVLLYSNDTADRREMTCTTGQPANWPTGKRAHGPTGELANGPTG